MKIHVEQEILQENKYQADQNRAQFGRILVVNLIGSPGCGKTTLLEQMLNALKDEYRIAVIEGDIYTAKDAARIEKCNILAPYTAFDMDSAIRDIHCLNENAPILPLSAIKNQNFDSWLNWLRNVVQNKKESRGDTVRVNQR